MDKELGRPWLQHDEQVVRKYPHKNGQICSKVVFLFRKFVFPLVNYFAVSVLEAIPCETDGILLQKV